jgi:hypothetical protein
MERSKPKQLKPLVASHPPKRFPPKIKSASPQQLRRRLLDPKIKSASPQQLRRRLLDPKIKPASPKRMKPRNRR